MAVECKGRPSSPRGTIPPAKIPQLDSWEVDLQHRRRAAEASFSELFTSRVHNVRNNPCGHLVTTNAFSVFIVVAIIANVVVIGIETDHKDPDSTSLDGWYIAEFIFTIIFLAEMVIKLIAQGVSGFIADGWNVFDAFIVVVSVADVVVLNPTFDSAVAQDVGTITLFRILRLVRLGRLLRFIRFFEHLFVLVRGMKAALKPLFWVSLLLFVLMYLFAVFATRLIGHADVWRDGDGVDDELVQEYFGQVDRSLYTLFQVMTLESWSNGIARVVMTEQPQIWILFVLWIAIATFTFINVITGIVVEKLMAASESASRARQHDALLRRLEQETAVLKAFRSMDVNGDGRLSVEEVHAALRDPKQPLHDTLQKFLPPDTHLDLEELTTMFDSNGDGFIEYEEFTRSAFRLDDNLRRKDVVVLNSKMFAAFQGLRREIDTLHRSVNLAIARQNPVNVGAMSPHDTTTPPHTPAAGNGSGRSRGGAVSPRHRLSADRLGKVMKGRGNSGLAPVREMSPPPLPALMSPSPKKGHKKRRSSSRGRRHKSRER